MNGRLQWIQKWEELARQANWSAEKLAKKCDVSLRTLERYFLETMGKCPRAWLCEQRQRCAIELLRDGCKVKKTATLLGYKHATHFSREFKKHWGHSPSTQISPLRPEKGEMS
jgi:transcriptional regulator GlxA family with amidase domain